MSSEQEIMFRLRQRDASAIGELYDLYGSRVYSLAVAILGNGMAAQEVVQDTFIRIWQNPHLYQPMEGKFVSWLLTIARRLAIDHLRHEQRRGGASASLDDDRFPDIHDTRQDEQARWRDLQHVMDELPAEQREVILLAYYRGLSQSEIALSLGIPLGTVKTRMRLGMAKLRSAYLQNE